MPITRVTLTAVLIGTACLGSGCPAPPKPTDVADVSPTPEVVGNETAGETTPEEETSPGGCSSDAQCIASTECKKASCVAGVCEETNQPDGTACSNPDPLCNTAAVCDAGTCNVEAAPAQCDGINCGTDACGNPCGTCPEGEVCVAGACQADPAGCGEVSFEGCCTADNVLKWCENDQLNTLDCTNDTQTPAVCSWWGENSFFGCIGELEATPDDVPYLCPGEVCEKSCDDPGVECGAVCGQFCGACGDGETCRPDNTCGIDACAAGIGSEGCCDGTTVTWCEDGASQTIICQNGCGWDAANGFYDCGEDGAEPTGTFPIDCVASNPGPETSEQVEQAEPAVPVDGAEHVETVPDAGGSETQSETLTGDSGNDTDVGGPNDDVADSSDAGAASDSDATDSADAGSAGDSDAAGQAD